MFLGLANFYCHFIKGFSKIAIPITKLLKKKNTQKFRWTMEAQNAFVKLYTVFTTALVLQHFNPAEMNYEIYDKEMLAIVKSLEHYRHYFEGLGQQITIYSDYCNLLWFTETKVYNHRQAR